LAVDTEQESIFHSLGSFGQLLSKCRIDRQLPKRPISSCRASFLSLSSLSFPSSSCNPSCLVLFSAVTWCWSGRRCARYISNRISAAPVSLAVVASTFSSYSL
jgi:hypothetical protein